MSKRVCLILPYFGEFPNYFDAWISGAKRNTCFEFYLITDNRSAERYKSENIHVFYMDLSCIKNRLEKFTGYKVKLDSPYKLCDYKPAYGMIFSDLIGSCDFWGYIDPDVILGDMSLLINDDTMTKFDMIGGGGMITALRNCNVVNTAFMCTPPKFKSYVFKEVCCTNKNLIFDEWGFQSILDTIQSIRKMDAYTDSFERFCDVLPPQEINRQELIRRGSNLPFYIAYKQGRVYLREVNNGMWHEKEYAMCHLQKRKLIIDSCLDLDFIIHRNRIVSVEDEDIVKKELEKLGQITFEPVKNYRLKLKIDSFSRFCKLILESPVSAGRRIARLIKDSIC